MHACSGIDLTGDTIGLAGIGTMCSKTSDELGHIFNMRHDNRRKCSYLRI